jgi:phosphatidylserine decarboxylase
MDVQRRAGWLPESQDDLESWLDGHCERVEARGEQAELHPVLTEFQELINTDPVVRMYLDQMIAQVPDRKPYRKRHLESVPQLLRLINEVLTSAPEFGGNQVATPLGAILDWTMGTRAGFAAYRDPRVNAMIKKILNAWCEFLSGGDSLYALNDSPTGWKSAQARQAIGIEQYEHDPKDEHWGFTSWNDFFTRRFKDGERPVASPGDDKVIVSACESTPYGISTDVKRQDRFWIKSQPYSLEDMLANDKSVDQLVGGTVYQAFLSATNYHRWHSPVAGTIVRAFVADGTYYSEPDSEGADAVEPMNSQSYLTHVAARAIIIIEADDPAIGQLAFVAVGMSDVSSCLIGPKVTPGYHVAKGEELGYFQYGGSTHCLVFRPGAIAEFALAAIPQPHDPRAPLMLVRSKLATASPTT